MTHNHYTFPRARFTDTTSIPRQLLHIASEFWEVIKALAVGDLEHAIEECYDLMHSAETLIRKLVDRSYQQKNILNPQAIKLDVIAKNRARGYYE